MGVEANPGEMPRRERTCAPSRHRALAKHNLVRSVRRDPPDPLVSPDPTVNPVAMGDPVVKVAMDHLGPTAEMAVPAAKDPVVTPDSKKPRAPDPTAPQAAPVPPANLVPPDLLVETATQANKVVPVCPETTVPLVAKATTAVKVNPEVPANPDPPDLAITAHQPGWPLVINLLLPVILSSTRNEQTT